MAREEWLGALDHLTPIGLEGIRRVVAAVAEEQPDAPVDDPVGDEFERGVALERGARHEARAKDALVAVLEQTMVGDQVLGAV